MSLSDRTNGQLWTSLFLLGLLINFQGCQKNEPSLSGLDHDGVSRKHLANIQSDESGLSAHLTLHRTGGLDEIISKRYVRILTTSNSFDYFIHEGNARGFQYEMAKAFIDWLNQKYLRESPLKIQFELVPLHRDQLVPELLAGKGDFIAADIAIDSKSPQSETKSVAYSKPYRAVDQWIITHFPVESYRRLEDFSGKQFAVQKSSASYSYIIELNNKLKASNREPVQIELVDEELEAENLLELVSLKKYDFIIADSHIAEIGLVVFENLRRVPKLTLGKKLPVSWVVPKSSRKLLTHINEFLPKFNTGTEHGNLNINKYYRNFNQIKNHLEKNNKTNTLSPFDHWIQKYSRLYSLDWRLMAALCYQESLFNFEARSDQGAIGLFQIKSTTASEPYIGIPDISGIENIPNNIHAGIKYFQWIKKSHFDGIVELPEKEKLRFTLAAYNAGPSTILRARELTTEMGLNPNQWFRNIEMAAIALDRIQTVKYVSEINKRYVSYVIYGFDPNPEITREEP